MTLKKARTIMIHMCLILMLLGFNNCSGEFESGVLSDIDSLEQGSSSTGTDGDTDGDTGGDTGGPVDDPPSGVSGGKDLTNSGYFVGCGAGASDSNDGLTHATRWASVRRVNNSVTAVGANVFFQTNCVYEDQQFNIDWDGTPDDMVEIDTYCIDAGDSNKPKSWTLGGAGCGQKAEINGTFDSCADTDPITCNVGTYNGPQLGSPVPSSIYDGLVDLGVGRQYIHLRNLKVHDSAARGVDMKGAHHIVIEGLELHRIAHVGLMAERNSRYVVMKGNFLDRVNAGEEAEDEQRLPDDWVQQANIGGHSQPSCIKVCVVNTLDAYCGAWGNVIKNCAGEAMAGSSAAKVWMEQNIAYDTGVSFYADHLHNGYVIRNLAAGSGNGSQVNQSGFSVSAEGTAVKRSEGRGTINQLWAFNITSGTALGIGVRNVGVENLDDGFGIWGLLYHNTVIQPIDYEGVVVGRSSGTEAITSELDIRANAIWADSPARSCRNDTDVGTLDYQSWSGNNPSDPQCRGRNDTTAALRWPHSAAEYRNITFEQATKTWTLADFKPRGANENAAPVLEVPSWAVTDLSSSGWDWARKYDGEGYFMWGAAGCKVDVSASALMTGADCKGLDATPDIGAVQ